MAKPDTKASLSVRDLHVYYGQSHAIQGVDLALERGILAVVGRNGMGKTTLCNSIVGLVASRSGSIRVEGREVRNRPANAIARLGVGYVPQGRRIWPSLSVDEHLRLAAHGGADAIWTVERIYDAFPRLAERRGNGGAQLSGGEQQMLAISRGLLGNPTLLIMDEPTEGLAPVIVQQVEAILKQLADEGDLSVLLIEQNIGVATEVSESVAIMVNGRINRVMPAAELAADRGLQQRLLGVGRHEDEGEVEAPSEEVADGPSDASAGPRYFSVRRAGAADASVYESAQRTVYRSTTALPNRWGTTFARSTASAAVATPQAAVVSRLSVSEQTGRTALVVGTFDTKATELFFIRDVLRGRGLRTRTVDVSTTRKASRADVSPSEVAASYAGGGSGVFTGDRGSSIQAMAEAFRHWISRQRDIGGIISAGGSGGTSLVTPGMRALPVGIPKLMISTVASGDVSRYVGPSDIMMMHSVADVQGINSISEQILSNGANALAGMILQARGAGERSAIRLAAKPAVGITMFGLTTPCVQSLTERLGEDYDCLVFHATGTGGRSMENLADSGSLAAIIDVTTTELADFHVGGIFAADDDRLGAVIRTRLPYVGSCGALDMVNFGAADTVPARFSGRTLHVHNPQVTLMRTTVEENARIGQWLGERLNLMDGPVRFLIPEGGLSGIDAPGQPFHDPQADAALFEAIERSVRQNNNRRIIRVPAHINDTIFVDALISAFREIYDPIRRRA